MFKASEEFFVAALVSVPACLLLFYLVRLQGALLLFWTVHLCSAGIAIGEWAAAGSIQSVDSIPLGQHPAAVQLRLEL